MMKIKYVQEMQFFQHEFFFHSDNVSEAYLIKRRRIQFLSKVAVFQKNLKSLSNFEAKQIDFLALQERISVSLKNCRKKIVVYTPLYSPVHPPPRSPHPLPASLPQALLALSPNC